MKKILFIAFAICLLSSVVYARDWNDKTGVGNILPSSDVDWTGDHDFQSGVSASGATIYGTTQAHLTMWDSDVEALGLEIVGESDATDGYFYFYTLIDGVRTSVMYWNGPSDGFIYNYPITSSFSTNAVTPFYISNSNKTPLFAVKGDGEIEHMGSTLAGANGSLTSNGIFTSVGGIIAQAGVTINGVSGASALHVQDSTGKYSILTALDNREIWVNGKQAYNSSGDLTIDPDSLNFRVASSLSGVSPIRDDATITIDDDSVGALIEVNTNDTFVQLPSVSSGATRVWTVNIVIENGGGSLEVAAYSGETLYGTDGGTWFSAATGFFVANSNQGFEVSIKSGVSGVRVRGDSALSPYYLPPGI